MMKILYLTPWFPSHRQDQEGNFILDSIESIAALGHEVTVLVTQVWRPRKAELFHSDWIRKEINLSDFSPQLNLHIFKHFSIPRGYFYTLSHLAYRYRIYPVLKKFIHQHHYQIIHAHTELAGLVAVKVGKAMRIPSVVTLHGIQHGNVRLTSPKARKFFYHFTLSNADRVVLVGNSLAKFMNDFVDENHHFRIVYNGFRIPVENSTRGETFTKSKKLRFISVSNLHEGKGIDINLQALAKLKNAGITEWSYKVVGDGRERKSLEMLAEQLGLTQNIQFFGACKHNDVYKLLMDADVFILPSYREAFGISYLEAMACGLLTIGIEGQGPSDFIHHRKSGFLVPPKNIDALAFIFKEIFSSRDKMQEIADEGKKHVYNHFSWANHAKNLTKVYEELVN